MLLNSAAWSRMISEFSCLIQTMILSSNNFMFCMSRQSSLLSIRLAIYINNWYSLWTQCLEVKAMLNVIHYTKMVQLIPKLIVVYMIASIQIHNIWSQPRAWTWLHHDYIYRCDNTFYIQLHLYTPFCFSIMALIASYYLKAQASICSR